jgi:hypothetical protein
LIQTCYTSKRRITGLKEKQAPEDSDCLRDNLTFY